MAGEALSNARVDEARARMLEAVAPLVRTERLALGEARGRILAEDVIAQRDQPPFAASAMDGYALRAADTPGTLRVIGEASAGAGLARALQAGEAARIFTGAPLPAGADCIAIQEDVTREGDMIAAPATAPGRHVRAQGLDFKAGARLLAAGARLDGVALALAAASGAAQLAVRARPRVALLATGDEIVAPGETPGPHQIFESVSFGLAGLIEEWGGEAIRLAARGDDVDALAAAAREGFAQADLLLTIGGASVGDRDLVKPALKTLGLGLDVERVAVRPGKPVWFGTAAAGPALGLPGNPASALVCAHLFLRPILARMLGLAPAARFVRARLAAPLAGNGPREQYLRARLDLDEDGRARVMPFEQQDSSLLSVFRDANALIRLAPGGAAMAEGALVDVLALER
ncbi:MAG: gephyrin-like molybdotransferase Glp [Hyphomonadaceae bacterium]